MHRIKVRCAVLAAAVALCGSARGGGFAAGAVPVWPAGCEREMNLTVAFRAAFDAAEGAKPVLEAVGWGSYRISLNGAFVGFGPARGPAGMYRPDRWPLAAKPGRNEVCVEVSAHNVKNFYLMDGLPFLKAAVVADGKTLAKTGVPGDFTATLTPRVQAVPRYSYQRTFAEYYRVTGEPFAPLPLAARPEPVLIPRRAPYPDCSLHPLALLSRAEARVDPNAPARGGRAIELPGKSAWFKGYPKDKLALNTFFLAQRLVHSNRVAATEAERKAEGWTLAAGRSLLFDRGLCDAGFPGATVTVTKPGRLVLSFDEILLDGEARGAKRYGDCCNAIVWDFERPGVYEADAFEPYVLRYADFAVLSGEMTLSKPRFRCYKNATAARATFKSSDPVLDRIFHAASETFRQNAVDVFTDCPSRERAGWNCDAFFTAPVSTLLTGDTSLERIFEENIALAKSFEGLPEGMLPMCYPADHSPNSYIPNWAMWFVLETEEYLRRSGDRETVEALRPRLEKLVSFLWTFRNADGLLEKLPSWVFVEWSHANKLVQDVNYPSNMTWSEMLEAMDRLYGRPDLAAEAKRVRETVRRQSWMGRWFCDNAVRQKDGTLKLSGECTETCQYYAFFHRVATPERDPALWKTLLADFGPSRIDRAHGNRLLRHPEIWPSNAFVGNYLRLKLLERAGLGAQILRETKGYFQYMADRTGTLWEHDSTHASCDHGFASYAAMLLVKSVLGAEIDLAAKTVTLRKTDVDLARCEATLPVGDGEIRVLRTQEGGEVRLTATVPDGWKSAREPAGFARQHINKE